MALTFDEAIAKVGTYLKNNDLSNSDNNDRFFYIILNDLRKEYSPAVEMTQAQYDELLGFKHKFGSSHLAAAIHQGNDGTWSFLDELSGRIFGHGIGEATDKNIETIMQAWLHPEMVKVVDNERN